MDQSFDTPPPIKKIFSSDEKKAIIKFDTIMSGCLIALLIILLISIGVVIWWFITSKNKLETCLSTESLSCPTFYCGNIKATGAPGTLCVNSKDPKDPSQKVAFRIYNNGPVQCDI